MKARILSINNNGDGYRCQIELEDKSRGFLYTQQQGLELEQQVNVVEKLGQKGPYYVLERPNVQQSQFIRAPRVEKVFKADPEKQESIERQSAYKTAVELLALLPATKRPKDGTELFQWADAAAEHIVRWVQKDTQEVPPLEPPIEAFNPEEAEPDVDHINVDEIPF